MPLQNSSLNPASLLPHTKPCAPPFHTLPKYPPVHPITTLKRHPTPIPSPPPASSHQTTSQSPDNHHQTSPLQPPTGTPLSNHLTTGTAQSSTSSTFSPPT